MTELTQTGDTDQHRNTDQRRPEHRPRPMTEPGDFLEKELSYKLLGCLFEVRKLYGRFHKEELFHRATLEIFQERGLACVSQPKITIYSFTTGKPIGWYNPDIAVEAKVLLELKALPFVPREQELRALQYLKASDYEILYLANFGANDFQPRRFIFTNDRKPFLTQRNI